ncbi:hypothetical protein HMPREF1318_3035 [Actinomyces massiliensis F0489]|uniref:Uncharacterized protein n=1 Tax=Actinomyces massiliensis F0489 TaxID=1125718 RepID=J1GV09_9ACTO|nr:hypothetical protein HMPREF1318_3035 [Actinomyces massiliensis F0489]
MCELPPPCANRLRACCQAFLASGSVRRRRGRLFRTRATVAPSISFRDVDLDAVWYR